MFDIADTTWLQFESVKRFAEAGGWKYDPNVRGFYIELKGRDGYKGAYISFNSMQYFHNHLIYLRGAKNKLVEQSSLHYNKKTKKWFSQRKLVKLVDHNLKENFDG